jgi:signal transduction histidine kinase/CheY-like chemotaxis protein
MAGGFGACAFSGEGSSLSVFRHRDIGAWWKWLRAGIRSSSRENLADYREILSIVGPVCAVLWPAYGIFCSGTLHLKEVMAARWVIGVGSLFLWVRSRLKRFGTPERLAWCGLAAVGIVWLPWHLYLLNDRDAYWQMSTIFFCLGLALAVRGMDILPTLAAGIALLALVDGSSFDSRDIPLLAVAVITLWLAVTGVHLLRLAHRRIAQQARLIGEQNVRLQVLDHRKDEVTANIAHDLRTPLAVALSLSEDLASADLDPPMRKRLSSLGEALKQMRRQCDELMDLQRFQLGVAKLDLQVVDLCQWLGRFEEGFSSMAHSRGLTFQVVLPSTVLKANVDPNRLETALFNLVANAFKFTPAQGHVEIHLRRQGGRGIALAVLDDGEGIPPDAIRNIFDRFHQVDRGPGTYTAGTGIGLALVKEIAQSHGGRVEVQSTLGLGSLFEIVLDDALVEQEGPPLELSSQPPQGGLIAFPRSISGHIALVAEDQQMLRHVLQDILGRIAKVATARDGREALRLVHELGPDIVVTDYSMPGMDGLELLAALRSDPATRDVPVVLLSGDSVTLRSRLADEPNLVVMSKPFEQSELLETVGHLLRSRAMGDLDAA